MKLIKRSILAILSACLLLGASPPYASAAGCNHKVGEATSTIAEYQWTGQYRYSDSSHTVTLGHYTDGRPITQVCHVDVREEIWLLRCTVCNMYAGTAYLNKVEAHEIVHN